MSKVKSGSGRSDLSDKRWASAVTISDNVARQGVELQFDNDPHPELQSKLRVAGFLPSKSPAMWYAKATANTRKFADNVKMVIAAAPTGPDMFIQPSYEPNKANIESKRFSFVQISLKSGQDKTYIVFEPSKPRAEVIASNFAYKQFGGEFLALAVNPKTRLREARMLFDEDRIIKESDDETRDEQTAAGDQNSSPLVPAAERQSSQETIGGEKANLSVILHQLHTWLKDHPEHKGSTKIGKPVYITWLRENYPQLNTLETEKLWDRHQRLVKIMHRIGNLDTKQIVAEPYSSIYKKLVKIIPELPEYLRSGKLFAGKSVSEPYMDLHVDFLYKDKEGYNLALAHYYKQNGDLVPDPDMRVRVMLDTNLAEAMSFQDYRSYDEVYSEQGGKDMVNLAMKKKLNSFLNQWLGNLITQGHTVKLIAEDDEEQSQVPSEDGVTTDLTDVENASQEKDIVIPDKGKEKEQQVHKVNFDGVQPVVGVDEHDSQYGESRKISESNYNALDGMMKRNASGAFTYEGKVWILMKDGDWHPAMQQLIGKGAINPIPKHPSIWPVDKNAKDQFANKEGYYTRKTAGNRLEAVVVPTPPETYKIELQLVVTSFDDYRAGFIMNKEFGKPISREFKPAQKDPPYVTRWEAMEEVLAEIISECNDDAEDDNYFDRKPELRAKFDATKEAIYKFAEDRGYTRADLDYKSKVTIFNLDVSLAIPVPELKAKGAKKGMSLRLTRPIAGNLDEILEKADCEVFYFENKAWMLEDEIMYRLPDLDTKAVKYYKLVYQKTAEYLKKQKVVLKHHEPSSTKLTSKDQYYLPDTDDPQLDKIAFARLQMIIPQLEKLMNGQKSQGTLQYERFGESKELTCFVDPSRHSIFLVEEVDGNKQMESDVTIDLKRKEARVTSEWLSDYYSEGLGRAEGDIEFEGDDMGLGRDMTRGLIQWMQDLIDEGLTVKIDKASTEIKDPLEFLDEPVIDKGVTGQMEFNPFAVASLIAQNPDLSDDWRHAYDAEATLNKEYTRANILRLKEFYNTYILEHEEEEKQYRELLYKMDDASFSVVDTPREKGSEPQLQRTYSPEEEKAILLAFDELGFKSPFTVKEAVDRKLPVIDLCFRYYDTEQYFRKRYGDPLTDQIRQLESESKNKNGTVKNKTDQDKARQNKIAGLSLKLAQAEKTYQDEFLIFQDDFILYVFQKAKAAGYMPSTVDQLTDFQVFVAESVFDGRTIENYPREPINKVIDELIADFFNPQSAGVEKPEAKRPVVQVVDLIRFGTLAPNVVIPGGTKEPFITGEFSLYDMKETIKTSFPHLRKLTNKSLPEATPLEMWELVQMSHPTDYGVKVDRQAMLEEWEKRGKKLFVDLGLPVDPEYPYVNANLGYESVEPLNQILFEHNNEGNQWWAVADNWRPIADLDKAVVFIDSQIATVQRSMDEKTNAKNGKPHGSQKDQHRQLQFILRDLQVGRKFITDYIAKNKALHPLTQEPASAEGQDSSTMPVFVNDAIAIPDHKITTPALDTARRRKISEKAFALLQDILKKGNSDLLYYQGGAFNILLDGSEGFLVERPELEALAAKYFEEKYKTTAEYKTREKNRVRDFKKSLEAAEWKGHDYRDEIDRITINAVVYHRVRLLAAVLDGFRFLFVADQIWLVNNLHENFNRRPKLEYQDAFGKADPGIRPVAQAYVKDTVIDNDFIASNAYGDRYYSALKGLLLDLSAVTPSHEPLKGNGKAKAELTGESTPVPVTSNETTEENKVVSTANEELVDQPVKPKQVLRKIPKIDQHKLNMEIEALIDEKDAKGASFSSEEKELISQYAGSGGLLKQGAKGRGVLYEYYTPDWLVELMWELATKYGYDGGSVLEPSVGTGNFLKYAPKGAIVFGFETNHYSARIAQVLYPHAHIHEKAFESLFFAGNIHLKDKIDHPLYSLVIGNPPYGEFTGKYAGMGEKKWTGAHEYDQYFMLRGLDLLQAGGLLVFLVPSLFIQSGQKYNKTKDKMFEKAEVLTCYRLPQNLFAATDIGTDIIVLRKRGTPAASKKQSSGIDQENLPTREAKHNMVCDMTGLAIHFGDRIFYDEEKNLHIKALKIKDGDNPIELLRKNPWLHKIIKEAFSNYMAKHGHRNELNEKYYGEDAIYDPRLIVDATVEYIHEVMKDNNVTSCWLHKIDLTEAFAE